MPDTPRDAFATGAARAAGERRRRRATPLVGAPPVPVVPGPLVGPTAPSASDTSLTPGMPSVPDPVTVASPAAASAGAGAATPPVRKPRAPSRHRPVPQVTPVPATETAVDVRPRTRPPVRRLRSVPTPSSESTSGPQVASPAATAGEDLAARVAEARQTSANNEAAAAPAADRGKTAGSAGRGDTAYRPRLVRDGEGPTISESLLAAALTQQELTPDIEDVIAAVIGVLRTLAAASGLGPDEVETQVARTLAFLRRRLTGEYLVDEFGFDQDYTENFYLPVLRPLYKQWFRVEVRGVENIPAVGAGLIVANHSGTIALDAHMVQVAVHDAEHRGRFLRLLGADLVFQTPLIGPLARKQGATLAANADAERLLSSGQLVGVFPEGFKGVGKPFSERYKLQRFGRGGFVSAAIRTGTPIIPCSIVGAEETYPLIGNAKLLARLFGAPYFPITPTWPWLGLLGLVPLPSKWIIEFGEPIPTAQYGSAGADDPMLVFDITDQVRETIQQTLYSLLMLRRSVFS